MGVDSWLPQRLQLVLLQPAGSRLPLPVVAQVLVGAVMPGHGCRVTGCTADCWGCVCACMVGVATRRRENDPHGQASRQGQASNAHS